MRILHARDYSVQPWKNGGGVTTEIIVSPAGATFDAFDWRISMAQVASSGPFSMFAGIDRSLGLLAGDGIVLRVDGRGEIELQCGDHPAVFPGDIPVDARLPGGAILDLNVMTRRTGWRHHLSRMKAAAGAFALERRGDVTVVVVRGAGGTAGNESFGDGDALMCSADAGDEAVSLIVHGTAELWVADLWRVAES
jgi:uncharacterized protein